MDIESKIEGTLGLGPSHKCLICSREVKKSGTYLHSTIDKQVQVIFILNKVLEIPSSRLVGFLQQWGNPECWIKLCDNCNEDIENVEDIYWDLIRISRKWDEEKKIIQEKIRCSNDGNGESDSQRDEETAHISRESMTVISQDTSLTEADEDDWNAVELVSVELVSGNEEDNEIELSDSGSGGKGNFDSEGDENYVPVGVDVNMVEEDDLVVNGNEEDNEIEQSDSGSGKKGSFDSEGDEDFVPVEVHVNMVEEDDLVVNGNEDDSGSGSGKEDNSFDSEGGEDLVPESSQKERIREETKCGSCSKTFKNKLELRAHIKKVHSTANSTKVLPDGGELRRSLRVRNQDPNKQTLQVVQCTKCGKEVTGKSSLAKHMRNCGNFECESCGEKFTSLIQFKLHKKKHTRPKTEPKPKPPCERPAHCHICGKSFARKSNLKKHITLVHERYFTIFCNLCGMGMQEKGTLKKHMASIHNIGDFQCGVVGCSKVFASQYHLVEHNKYIHEGHKRPERKKLCCEFCGYKTSNSSTLKKHLAKVHQVS